MYGLESQFQPHVSPLCVLFEESNHLIRYTIRSRTHGNSHDVFFSEGFVIECSQRFHRCVGVGESLKVDDKLGHLLFLFIEFLPSLDLLSDRRERSFSSKTGSSPIAIDTSSRCDCSIPVRARKAGVNLQLVYTAPEVIAPETLQIIVSLCVVPEGWFHYISLHLFCLVMFY